MSCYCLHFKCWKEIARFRRPKMDVTNTGNCLFYQNCTNTTKYSNTRSVIFLKKWNIDCLFSLTDYVDELRINLVECRRQFTSCPSAAAEADTIRGYKPPPLISSYVSINKKELVAMRRSRFSNWKGIVVEWRGSMCDQINSHKLC